MARAHQAQLWRYKTLASGNENLTPLALAWELDGDPITDDYTPAEIGALDLWKTWRRQYRTDDATEEVFGSGAHRIWWFVDGGTTFEGAPFCDHRGVSHPGENFLQFYSWPVAADTGERLRWSALPVADKLWRPGRGDKGGFIQEVTGWKPSPLQPFVNVTLLEQMAGLR